MEDNKTVNVAQIGVGYWGPNLLRNLVANKRCNVKYVADVNRERRSFVKGLYPSVTVTNQSEEVISDPSVDAVVIATPAGSHYDLAMQALNSGKHILVEKPMAGTAEEVWKIGELAAKKNLVAMVGHTFIFNAAVRFIKQYIDSGKLGEIRYIYSQRLNLGRIRSDVDALWNFAPHDVSIIQYLMNDTPPVSVSVCGMDYIQDGIDDVSFMNIAYPSKVMANVHVSWLDPRKVRSMTVVGSHKMIVYDDIAESKIAIYDKGIDRMAVLGEHMDFDTPQVCSFNMRSGDVLLPKIEFAEPLKHEVAHFFDCIIDGVDCMTGPEHALEVVRILSEARCRDAERSSAGYK